MMASRPTLSFHPMKRRDLLKYTAGVTLASSGVLLLKACGGSDTNTPESESTLPIPDIVRSGADNHVTLRLQKGQHAFLEGKPTDTFGVNGALLGPALFLKRGGHLNVRVENELDEESVLHWHGLQVEGAADGGPQQAIGPGGSYTVKAPVDQPGATLWYHAHPHGRTGYQTAMGIGGLLIVEDEAEAALGLPAAWGEDDIPVVLQDKHLDGQGHIVYKLNHNTVGAGWLGQHMFVNGATQPVHHAPRGWVRLRLLNACNTRATRLKLGSGTAFHVIASDGGLLATPVAMEELVMLPGERFEIMVDGASGQPFDLVMAPFDGQYGANTAPFNVDYRLLTIHPNRPARNSRMPAVLTQLPPASEPPGIRHRKIQFELMGHFPLDADPTGPLPPKIPYDFAWNNADSMFDEHMLHHINQISVDGEAMHSFSLDHASFEVPRQRFEKWSITLRHGDIYAHNFHVHGTQFRILSINGATPPAHLQGWKDTVTVPSASTVRSESGTVEILLRFEHEAKLPHPYMVHCHILEHEDGGMMLGFAVA